MRAVGERIATVVVHSEITGTGDGRVTVEIVGATMESGEGEIAMAEMIGHSSTHAVENHHRTSETQVVIGGSSALKQFPRARTTGVTEDEMVEMCNSSRSTTFSQARWVEYVAALTRALLKPHTDTLNASRNTEDE